MATSVKTIKLLIDEFQYTRNIETLWKAAESIDGVQPTEEIDFKKRKKARFNKLKLWLLLLNQIDQQTDPHFRPENYPSPASNEEKLILFNFQTNLRKLDDWATPRVNKFIGRCYLKSPKSRKELGVVVVETIGTLDRQKRLNDLLA